MVYLAAMRYLYLEKIVPVYIISMQLSSSQSASCECGQDSLIPRIQSGDHWQLLDDEVPQFLEFAYYKQSFLNLIAEEVGYSISGLVTQRMVDELTDTGAVDELCDSELPANETENE